MNYFAHAGVEHATSAEEAAHAAGLHPAIIVALLTLGAIVLIVGATYLLKRFSVITIPIEKDKEL